MDLFEEKQSTSPVESTRHQPLATRMRPMSVREIAGQQHILKEGQLLRRMIETGAMGSVIFYGPPSSGKTTLASVIATSMDAEFVTLNAVLDGVKDLKLSVERARDIQKYKGRKTLLFVDEIHRWNRAQQDALLPHLESGLLTLIGATTENPFYALVGPLLSRCQLFELKALVVEDVLQVLERALNDAERGLAVFKPIVDEQALLWLAEQSGGDVRNALNALEVAVKTTPPNESGQRCVTVDIAKQCIQKRLFRFDKTGDEHYHYASALIKSLRGSDPDAGLYWAAAMLESGVDPQFLFRRLLIFASEDVGMADSALLVTLNALWDSFTRVGMPEGWYFISHAILYCALAPKSNSTAAIFEARQHIQQHGIGQVPAHLKDRTANALASKYTGSDNPSEEYKYPHEFPNHFVAQQYLPDAFLKAKKQFYESGDQGFEKRYAERLKQIKG